MLPETVTVLEKDCLGVVSGLASRMQDLSFLLKFQILKCQLLPNFQRTENRDRTFNTKPDIASGALKHARSGNKT